MRVKGLCALLLCLCLTGCGKEKVVGPAPSDENLLEQVTSSNGYQKVTDIEMQDEYKNFDVEIWPDYFTVSGIEVHVSDFATREQLYATLEKLNITLTVSSPDYPEVMPFIGQASEFQRLIESRDTCTLYFSDMHLEMPPEAPGLLGIRIEGNSVYAEFYYAVQKSSFEGIIFTYEDLKLNVLKTSSAWLNEMLLATYEEAVPTPKPMAEEEGAEVEFRTTPYKDITDSMHLDTELGDTYNLKAGDTYTGVIYFDVTGAIVRAEDTTSVRAACDACIRMSHVMRMYYGDGEETKVSMAANPTTEDLVKIVEEQGSLTVSFYEFADGNCRVDATITSEGATFTLYPTGQENVPNMTVCFDTMWVPYYPYKYNHEMSVRFTE